MMDGIQLMIDEHVYIKRMLKVMRTACLGVMNGQEIVYEDFESMIGFVRNYADQHHHGKEEKILFTRMVDEIGGAAEKLVKHGMLVEHDMGRLYMKELEEALESIKAGDDSAKLDVIANAISYTHLLYRHIEKEDKVVYAFAKRELASQTLDQINEECDVFEEKSRALSVQQNYIALLEEMEYKYKEIK